MYLNHYSINTLVHFGDRSPTSGTGVVVFEPCFETKRMIVVTTGQEDGFYAKQYVISANRTHISQTLKIICLANGNHW